MGSERAGGKPPSPSSHQFSNSEFTTGTELNTCTTNFPFEDNQIKASNPLFRSTTTHARAGAVTANLITTSSLSQSLDTHDNHGSNHDLMTIFPPASL